MAQLEKLQAVIAPVVADEGLMLWGIEYQSSSATVLLVYIDSPNGVSVDDCAKVSRQLSVILDVEDFISGEYRLEVSSPGMSRTFFSIDQYSEYIGHLVKVKLHSLFEGRRQIKGILSSVDTENREIGLVDGDEEYVFPYELIERGQLFPVYNENAQ